MWATPRQPLPLQLRRQPPPPFLIRHRAGSTASPPHRTPSPPSPTSCGGARCPRRPSSSPSATAGPPRGDSSCASSRPPTPRPVPSPALRPASPPWWGRPASASTSTWASPAPGPTAPSSSARSSASRTASRRRRRVVLHTGQPRRSLRQEQAPGGVRPALRSGGFEGRATVPLLWDAERREVVCNESIEIAKFLCGLGAADGGLDLWPPELRQDIDRWYGVIYPSVNNGVYRCGFARIQEAYDAAASELFGALDRLEAHLAGFRYLCGDRLTLADVCLFTTLIRFDAVYNPLFRCSRRKLAEYPSLHAYTRDIYQMPKVAETCDMEANMAGYFKTLFPLNPGGIQPLPPASCDRESLLMPHEAAGIS